MLSKKSAPRFARHNLANAIALASLPIAGVVSQPLQAQAQQVFEEIIVTSSRREENVLDIPLNITAVSGEMIGAMRLDGISKIAFYVPGLTVVDRGPRDEVPDILVRGLNTTGLGPGFVSDTVATYFGEIPLQLDIKPVDLERVEVLIGPQGTLYGQGTMGGAIRYLPMRADVDEFSAAIRSDTSRNTESKDPGYNVGTTLNVPLVTDTLAARINVDRLYDPGFIDYGYVVREPGVSNPEPDFSDPADVAANLQYVPDANGENTLSGRLNLRWLPNDWLDANFWYLHQNTRAEGRQVTHQLAFGTDRYTSAGRYLEPNIYKNEMSSFEIIADLGFAQGTFSYGKTKYKEYGQRDQTDLLLSFEYGYELFPSFSAYTREDVDQDTDTFELRLASQYDGPFSWIAGYFDNELDSYAISKEFTPGFDQFAVDNFDGVQLRPDSLEYIQITDQFEKEQALYGELAWQFADVLTATVGYRRYEFEVDTSGGFGLPLADTVFGGEPPDSINVDLGTNAGADEGDLFKFNVAWEVTDDSLAYFTWSQGYRNGGVNSVPECTPEQITSTAQQLCALADEVLIKPDQIDNWEVGYKGIFYDKLSAGVSLFFIDWEDLQVSTTTVNGSLPITGNGSKAESKGVEAQGRLFITDALEATFTYAYTNAELTERAPGLVGPFDALAGARLPGHAEHQGSLNFVWNTVVQGYDLAVNYGLVYSSDVYNIVGGSEDPLVDAEAGDAPGDRGGEAIPGYALHHLSATVTRDNWMLQGYIDNLFDKYYITGTMTSRRNLVDEMNGPGKASGDWTMRSYGQFVGAPRNIGVRLNYMF